jgi:hypothetical protein
MPTDNSGFRFIKKSTAAVEEAGESWRQRPQERSLFSFKNVGTPPAFEGSRRLVTEHERRIRQRLAGIGKTETEIHTLLEQFEYQLQKGYMADRHTQFALNSLLKLVSDGRYQAPHGFRPAYVS